MYNPRRIATLLSRCEAMSQFGTKRKCWNARGISGARG
jgi:hypothetical protein